MNSVSWLIYLANVISNLNSNMGFLFAVLSLGTVVYTIIWFIMMANEVEERGKYRCFPIYILVGMLVVGTFIPDRRTIIAIAASETTEMAINSDIGKQGYDYIKEFLTKEINTLRQENEKKSENK